MECSSIIASVPSSSMVCRNRTIHGHVSIDSAEKENVNHTSVAKVRADEQPLAANEAMNISAAGPTKAKPKIKLFEKMRQMKSTVSETLHKSKDMSLELSSNASNRKTAFTAKSIMLDDDSHSPPHPSQLHQMNETNVKNTDMSVIFAPARGSVICKSPRKNPSNRNNKNNTMNFGNDMMDVTQGARAENNLQESRYPLNAIDMDQSYMDVPKPPAVTNPYLKMFLGGTLNNSNSDREPTTPPSDKRNVTAHDTLPIEMSMVMDHTNCTELVKYPDAVKHFTTSETMAPINARNGTICDLFSIDKSFDFALPNPVAPMDDKENIMLSTAPEFDERKVFTAHTSDSSDRVSLSETVNTTVFNFHRNNIVNSTYCSNDSNLDMTPRPPGKLTNVTLDGSVAAFSPDAPLTMPQLLSRPTIYCDQSILNDTQMSDHGNERNEITIPVTTPQEAPVLKQRRVTCFKTESIDESMAFDNVVQINEPTEIPVSPEMAAQWPVNATVHDGRMSMSTTPNVSIEHHRNAAGRKTTVFINEPISAETSLKKMSGSALNSYHYLSMEQTGIASRDTSAILPSSTLLASPTMPPHYSIDTSRPLDDFVQLTFIGDEDIEDENMELVESIDSVDGDNDKIVEQTIDVAESRREKSEKMPTLLSRSNSSTVAFETRIGNSQMSLASPMHPSTDELHAFKKSNLLQNTGTTMHVESIAEISPVASKSIKRCSQNRTVREAETILPIEGNHDDTNINESSSYLHNVTVDKHVKDIKVDFSGYEKFRGLATPNDVCNAFFQRCEIFKQRMHQMRETARMKNIPDPQSQNVEAPSLKFLFFNKLATLE